MPDPVKSDLEKTVAEFRRDLLARERAAASQMVRQYGEAWKRIQRDIELLTRRYYAAVAKGDATSTFWLYEFERLQKLRRQTEAELYKWAQDASAAIRAQQAEALRAGGREAYELMRAAGVGSGISTEFTRLPREAIENMIGTFQAQSPVHLRLQVLAAEGAQAVEDGLVQGMALGQGPRVIARNIRDALGLGLSRALVWSRTEPLRAYRAASIETYRANSDVVEGWVWRSARNSRTCAACWSMDGSVHGLEEPLDDHPNGRCFATPKLHGVDVKKEPGSEAFKKLTEAQQLEVLGPAKYAAWKDGAITLDENPVTGVVGRRWDPHWGSMRYERSLKEMGIDAKQYYKSGAEVTKTTAASRFTPATTIQEANDYAVNVLGLSDAEYKGLDIKLANEWNKGLTAAFDEFPELKNGFDLTGTTQARYRKQYDFYLQRALKQNSDLYDRLGLNDAKRLKAAQDSARRYALRTPSNSYAYAADDGKWRGVFVTDKYTYDAMIKLIERDVASGFHPVGCTTPKYILDHEIGHKLDDMLKLVNNDQLNSLISDTFKRFAVESELSKYAKNRAEFIAEAWSEYKNNPNPRPIAKKVGQIIEKAYKDWKK